MLRVRRKHHLRQMWLQSRVIAHSTEEARPNVMPIGFSTTAYHAFVALHSSTRNETLVGGNQLTDRGFVHVDEHVRATLQRLDDGPPNPLQIRMSLRKECA